MNFSLYPRLGVLVFSIFLCSVQGQDSILHLRVNGTDSATVAGGTIPNVGSLGAGTVSGAGAMTLSTDIPHCNIPLDGGDRSLSFSGDTGILAPGTQQLLNSEILAAGGFAYEAWFNYAGGGNVNSIIDYAGTEKLARYATSTGPTMQTTGIFPAIGPAAIGEWHYAAAIYHNVTSSDGGETLSGDLTFYFDSTTPSRTINGVEVNGVGDSLNRTIGIGMHPSGFSGDFFNGLIYEPRVSLGALEPDELLFTEVPPATSPPFWVSQSSAIRADFTSFWTGADNELVTDGQVFATSPDRGDLVVSGSTPGAISIDSSPGLTIPSPRLQYNGAGSLRFEVANEVQGLSFQLEAINASAPDYHVSFYACGGGLIDSYTISPISSADNAVVVGLVDPAARLGIVEITTSTGEAFAISSPNFQVFSGNSLNPANLPVAGSVTVKVLAGKTYLREAVGVRGATPATVEASEDFANICDLREDFPTLQTGDILHFERSGFSLIDGKLNPTLAVFSSSNELADGTSRARVPGALDAGFDIYTRTVVASGVPSATNIPEDFIVGASSFVPVPEGAQFAYFSLAEPLATASPVNINISHIPRNLFLDWVANLGLTGPLAELDSDLDGDGLTLLEEFAYGRNPVISDAESDGILSTLPTGRRSTGEPLSLVFAARTDAPLRYTAEYSDDLQTWREAPAGSSEVLVSDSFSNRALFRIIDSAGGASASRRFGRLTIEYLPPVSQ